MGEAWERCYDYGTCSFIHNNLSKVNCYSYRHPLTGKLDSLPEKEEKEGDEGSSYNLPHPVWTKEELENVTITHNVPETVVDKVRREREGSRGVEGRRERGDQGGGRGRERGRETLVNYIRTSRDMYKDIQLKAATIF